MPDPEAPDGEPWTLVEKTEAALGAALDSVATVVLLAADDEAGAAAHFAATARDLSATLLNLRRDEREAAAAAAPAPSHMDASVSDDLHGVVIRTAGPSSMPAVLPTAEWLIAQLQGAADADNPMRAHLLSEVVAGGAAAGWLKDGA